MSSWALGMGELERWGLSQGCMQDPAASTHRGWEPEWRSGGLLEGSGGVRLQVAGPSRGQRARPGLPSPLLVQCTDTVQLLKAGHIIPRHLASLSLCCLYYGCPQVLPAQLIQTRTPPFHSSYVPTSNEWDHHPPVT